MMNNDWRIADCQFGTTPQILAIVNHAIANSCDIYDLSPRTLKAIEEWLTARIEECLPVLGVFDSSGQLLGFGSYSVFRPFQAYSTTVEHSIYVREDHRRQGVGALLLSNLMHRAKSENRHCMVAGIDSGNVASLNMHRRFGFQQCGQINQVARKFDRWLDLVFLQRFLSEI